MARLSPDMQIRQIRTMALTMDDEDIARVTGCDFRQVQRITAAIPMQNWWGRNNKTGQTVTGRGQRGVYRQITLKGWVDWDWGIGQIGENPQP